MEVSQDKINELVECGRATCGNSFLMDDGRVLTKNQFCKLHFGERLRLVAVYKYNRREVLKI